MKLTLSLSSLSIRNKLVLFTVVVTAIVLSLVVVVTIFQGFQTLRETTEDRISSLATVIAVNSAGSLSSRDKASAVNTLKALHGQAEVTVAALFDIDNNLFASYVSPDYPTKVIPRSLEANSLTNTESELVFVHRISLDGEILGTLVLKADLRMLIENLYDQIRLAFSIFLGSIVVATVLSFGFHKALTGPIVELVRVTTKIREQGDYTLRVQKQATDEVGTLVDSFNAMLDTIEQKDEGLRQNQQTLEDEVKTRTKELEINEARTRAIIESAGDGILVLDTAGLIELANPAALTMLLLDSNELLGKHIGEFLPELNRLFRERALRDLEAMSFHLETKRKDDSHFPSLVSLNLTSPLEERRYVVIIRDVTSFKLAEESLKRSKEEAEAASNAKSEFLANMSHEIRTPMNGVLGMTELALETELTPEQREYISIARESALSLMNLLNDILDYSKIESGRLEIETIPFEIDTLLRSSLQTLAARFANKKLELLCRVLPDVPRNLLGDPARIRQVLVNLLSNAEKFTQEGEVEVCVSVAGFHETDGSAQIRFQVKDTGIGIPLNKQKLIFESFQQADSSTTRKYGGTGLGLSISKRLVDLMHGEIGIESEEGCGATFWFTLPLQVVEGVSPVQKTSLDKEELFDKRVLLIDDNKTNLFVLGEMVKEWGMRAYFASHGEGALRELDRAIENDELPHIIVTDHHMPDIDGSMLVTLLKERPALKEVPIIVLSSAADLRYSGSIIDLGVTRVALKPVLAQELQELFLQVLSQPQEVDDTLDAKNAEERIIRPLGNPVLSPPSQTVIPLSFKAEGTPAVRILVAEDNPVNQQLIVNLLTKQGFGTDLVSNGEELMTKLTDYGYFSGESVPVPFDLILLDIQMPVLSGGEVLQQIREKEKMLGRHIPIIALTAHAMMGDKESYLEAGADGYVSKPINRSILFKEIERLTKPSKQ